MNESKLEIYICFFACFIFAKVNPARLEINSLINLIKLILCASQK